MLTIWLLYFENHNSFFKSNSETQNHSDILYFWKIRPVKHTTLYAFSTNHFQNSATHHPNKSTKKVKILKVNFLIIQVTRDYQSWICLPQPCKRSLKKFPWNDDLSSSEKLLSMENLTVANLVTALWMHQLLQPNEQQSSHLSQSTRKNACNWNYVNIRLFKI